MRACIHDKDWNPAARFCEYRLALCAGVARQRGIHHCRSDILTEAARARAEAGIALLAAKLILTSISIGGGFPGGVFAPARWAQPCGVRPRATFHVYPSSRAMIHAT
jgi:hypothetical protein